MYGGEFGSLMVSYFKVKYWVFVQLPKVKSYLTTIKHLDPISPIWWSQWFSKHELIPLVKVAKNMVRFDNSVHCIESYKYGWVLKLPEPKVLLTKEFLLIETNT